LVLLQLAVQPLQEVQAAWWLRAKATGSACTLMQTWLCSKLASQSGELWGRCTGSTAQESVTHASGIACSALMAYACSRAATWLPHTMHACQTMIHFRGKGTMGWVVFVGFLVCAVRAPAGYCISNQARNTFLARVPPAASIRPTTPGVQNPCHRQQSLCCGGPTGPT
jgi:hypothetical protein